MNIHEYQAKNLLSQFGIPVLKSHVVNLNDDLQSAINTIENQSWMLKAQIHAGGRGKAGGIVRVDAKRDLLKKISDLY